MSDEREFVSLSEAYEILQARGVDITRIWITRKANDGKIENAQKIGTMWFIPRAWAETYVKSTKGRKPRSKTE